jgi:hypothetical protein
MASIDECLTRIDDVVSAAADPRAAYLIRSRLRRAILSCARLVAETHGTPKPDIPGVFATPPESDASDARVIALCNSIFFSAQELCQPSESFDVRWEAGWALLGAVLDDLREALIARNGQSTLGAHSS